MTKLENLFAEYPCTLTDAGVKAAVEEILAKHFDENNNAEVWKQCLHSIDLTTLNGEDTTEKVETMAQRVNEFEENFPGVPNVAAMCVYPSLVQTVADTLTEPIGIAAVAAGFPASQTFIEVKIAEAAMAVAAGATEIDIVISIGKFLEGNYQEVFDEISEIKAAIKDAHLKVILETGALKTVENIYKASILAMAAGADFIKTSTGKVDTNATPVAAYVMCECIAKYHAMTGRKVGFKPAGGISTAAEALSYYSIVSTVLGKEWLNKDLFRFGVSRVANSLLAAVEQKTVSFF